MEVGGDRVLEQVDAEVAEEHEQEGVGHVGALRQHPHEGGRQHEARAAGDEVAQAGGAVLVGGGDDGGAGDIRGGRDGRKRQVC